MSLSENGFIIEISNLTQNYKQLIKSHLEIKKILFNGKEFKLRGYKINGKNIILPIYFVQTFLKDIKFTIDFKTNFDRNFCHSTDDKITLKSGTQITAYNKMMDEFKKQYGGGLINLTTGTGKCFAKNTKILLYSRGVVLVQDIKPGCILLGDDFSPRIVKSCVVGFEEMYTIVYSSGRYTVNKSHTLVLMKNNKQVLLTVEEYLNLSKDERNEHYGCKVNPNVPWDIEVYPIEVIKSDEIVYYGFELFGQNRLFLLADYTIARNTVISLKVINNSNKKTLVVVNKRDLLSQWKQEQQHFFPSESVGIIQGKTFDTTKKITIGMLHTIVLKDTITNDHFLDFETLVIDEVHNIPTENFSKLLFKVRPRYIFGLSATLNRQDDFGKLLPWFIGDVLCSNLNDKKQESEVYFEILSQSNVVEHFCKPFAYTNERKMNISKMINDIAENESRSKLIVQKINDVLQSDSSGRYILVVSDRIHQLKYIHSALNDLGDCNIKSCLFISETKPELLKEYRKSESYNVLLATYKMVGEGFNCPRLNTIILASPRSNITQTIGRIFRKVHNKYTCPLIIDYVDYNYNIFKAQYYKRKKLIVSEINKPKIFQNYIKLD